MTLAQAQAEKKRYVLVTFLHGDPASLVPERYTTWGQNPGGGFQPTPQMKVELPTSTGTLDDNTGKITLPNDAFTANFQGGKRHTPTFVQVIEVTRSTFGGPAGSELHFFNGRVHKTKENPGNRPNLTQFIIKSRKGRLKIPLGVPCTHHCVNTLFGRGCRVPKHTAAVTIDDIDGKVVTIDDASFTAPTSPGGNTDFFWDRGYLEKDGLRIPIQNWALTDPTQCYLRRRPPDSWLGASVTAVAGCHKTIEDCRDVWDNEAGQGGVGGFNGIGFGIPPYNPLFENPSDCG